MLTLREVRLALPAIDPDMLVDFDSGSVIRQTGNHAGLLKRSVLGNYN
jgi:hypothetical protein